MTRNSLAQTETKTPLEMRKVISKNANTMNVWNGLTPLARRDFISWVESAKKPETRSRRIESIPSRLASGKRRPCCYALVPMNLYKALGASPKAKATWKSLSPDEKRDYTDWIDEAKESYAHSVRIAKVCAHLSQGFRRI